MNSISGKRKRINRLVMESLSLRDQYIKLVSIIEKKLTKIGWIVKKDKQTSTKLFYKNPSDDYFQFYIKPENQIEDEHAITKELIYIYSEVIPLLFILEKDLISHNDFIYSINTL